MNTHAVVPCADPSDPGEARRRAVAIAARAGFDDNDAGRAALVATEAATNIVKHAGSGQMLLRPLVGAAGAAGLELLALDRGPGMADVARCLQDGYSTAGSPGNGLGAIARLASSLELYSAPGLGTALLARLWPKGAQPPPASGAFAIGGVQVAAPGERECGDGYAVEQAQRQAVLLLVDGLGHGPLAAKAAAEAVRVFREHSGRPLPEILHAAHAALFATRGAAMSLAAVDLDASEVRFAGVGNVSGLLAWPGGSKTMITHNGTVGAQLGRVRELTYPWTPGAVLVMYSDGLTTHVNLQAYPGLLARDPSLIAAVLLRDFARGRDDATVVVATERAAP